MAQTVSSYNNIAGMYHRLWADWYLPAALSPLERLFFSQIPPGCDVLDLCCGSGHVTKELVSRGYNVTGVDVSSELIQQARRDLPGVRFAVQDVRDLHLDTRFDAILSTFDSLNHILTLEELQRVFKHVRDLVNPDGLFVFDMNLEEAYSMDLHEWSVTSDDNNVTLVRGEYDTATHLAATHLIWFRRDADDSDVWRRKTSVVEERCYTKRQILGAIAQAGFRTSSCMSGKDAGMNSSLGFGRYFFSARP